MLIRQVIKKSIYEKVHIAQCHSLRDTHSDITKLVNDDRARC